MDPWKMPTDARRRLTVTRVQQQQERNQSEHLFSIPRTKYQYFHQRVRRPRLDCGKAPCVNVRSLTHNRWRIQIEKHLFRDSDCDWQHEKCRERENAYLRVNDAGASIIWSDDRIKSNSFDYLHNYLLFTAARRTSSTRKAKIWKKPRRVRMRPSSSCCARQMKIFRKSQFFYAFRNACRVAVGIYF